MINDWARTWGVPPAAIADLAARLTLPAVAPVSGLSEAAVASRMRLEAGRKGIWLGRNNSGVAFNEKGQPVRFGLGNESSHINADFKSSDYLGLKPGTGQFIARETKESNWRYRGTDREEAQLNFLVFITTMGGDAAFCTGEGSL